MPPTSANSQPTKKFEPNSLNIALIVILVIFLGLIVWLFTSRQSYKNNSDAKVRTAVTAAKAQQTQADQQAAAVAAKAPYKTFSGPSTYGTITFNYPKTYSAYNDTTSGDTPVNAYFYPDVVPSPQTQTAFALRLELTSQAYADVLGSYSSQIGTGDVKALAYVPPKMKNVANVTAGMILTGAISTDNQDFRGTLVIIKVRDKIMKIYDESTSFDNDFNNIVLPSLTFNP